MWRTLGLALLLCLLGALVGEAKGETPPAESAVEFRRALDEFDQAQSVQTANPDRARRLFRLAAQRFESIAARGVVNGQLEYNLANCYLRAGDLGLAILHYRRAERLIPGDPLLADNLAEARSRCLVAIQPTRRSAFIKSVFFWHYQTSVAGRARAALVLYVAIWSLLLLRNLVPRRAVTVAAILVTILAAAAAGSVATDRWADRNAPQGVLIAMDVIVYKGPGTEYQRQFEQPLQPGVEFTLPARRGGWWRIELADGKSGWIQTRQAERIDRPGGS